MAYDDSGELPISSDPSEKNTYGLGGYNFELKVQNTHEPGEPDVVSVFAICHSPDGSRETVPMDFPTGTTVESWTVEANETEASVYVKIKPSSINPWDMPPFSHAIVSQIKYSSTWSHLFSLPVHAVAGPGMKYVATACDSPFTKDSMQGPPLDKSRSYTYNGKTVYWMVVGTNGKDTLPIFERFDYYPRSQIAWQMIYGSFEEEEEENLVARFAIDLREADGGPDGPWDEPGDVGPDPEKHFTLTVSVTGASSGSNSGTPLEPGQAGGYGNGGTGGNGGGGGAGASTVIIYEFATNKADNVVQEATAQGPGTGGPGGKGGKGGDGCILIFY